MLFMHTSWCFLLDLFGCVYMFKNIFPVEAFHTCILPLSKLFIILSGRAIIPQWADRQFVRLMILRESTNFLHLREKKTKAKQRKINIVHNMLHIA